MQTDIPNASTGSTDTTATDYVFDNLNRLYSVTDHHGQVTTYTYDDVGNSETVTYPNGTSTTYVYDALNRLETMQTVNASNQIISQFDYTLYPTGHRAAMTDLAGTVTSYQYDDLYRLTQETINHVTLGTVINRYDYDDVGNRMSATENGQTTTYTYDANDRMLSSTQNGVTTSYTYDDNGNTLSQADNSANAITSHFTYDARNKLVFVEQLENGAPTNSIDYQYDIDGNRTQKADNSGIVNFVVDRNQQYAQVVHEVDSQNQTQVTYTHGDDLISQDRNAAINYYNYDGLGSTRALTDTTGTITDAYLYNAYGNVLDQSGSTANDYLFTGEQYDSSQGNYYLRNRYYDPDTGTFNQMDTWPGLDTRPLSLNKYIYTEGDPVNAIDPSGNSQLAKQLTTLTLLSFLVTITTTQPLLLTVDNDQTLEVGDLSDDIYSDKERKLLDSKLLSERGRTNKKDTAVEQEFNSRLSDLNQEPNNEERCELLKAVLRDLGYTGIRYSRQLKAFGCKRTRRL